MDPLRQLCGLAIEPEFHILWQCIPAMDVWSMGNKKF
jgi:hypothetical protein